jgi:hypothetical protein
MNTALLDVTFYRTVIFRDLHRLVWFKEDLFSCVLGNVCKFCRIGHSAVYKFSQCQLHVRSDYMSEFE